MKKYDEERPMMEEEMIKEDEMILEEWMLRKERECWEVGEMGAFIVLVQNRTAEPVKLHFEPSSEHPTHWRKMPPILHPVVMYIAIEVLSDIKSMSPVPYQCLPLHPCCLLV